MALAARLSAEVSRDSDCCFPIGRNINFPSLNGQVRPRVSPHSGPSTYARSGQVSDLDKSRAISRYPAYANRLTVVSKLSASEVTLRTISETQLSAISLPQL